MQSIYSKGSFAVLLILFVISWGCNQVDRAVSDPVPDCFDGVLNQGEIDIDCGGPCPACRSKLTAKVNGMNWESQGSVASLINQTGTSILISSGNSTSNLSLTHTGNFAVGSYTLSGALYTIIATSTHYTANTGVLNITQWDNNLKQISGTFSFKAFEVSGSGDSVMVTQGKFINVPFQD